MVAYLFQKTLLDLWDHFLATVVLNLIFFGAIAALFLVYPRLPAPWGAVLFVVVFYSLNAAQLLFWRYVNADTGRWGLAVLAGAVLPTLLGLMILGVGFFSAGYYFARSDLLNLTLGLTVLWGLLSWLVGSLFYPRYWFSAGVTRGAWAAMKASFALFIRNPLTSLLVWIFFVLLSALSVTLVAGLGAALILAGNLAAVLECKVRFLAQNPNHRGRLPWPVVLGELWTELKARKNPFSLRPWK